MILIVDKILFFRAKHQQPSSRRERNYRVICFQKNLIQKKTNITDHYRIQIIIMMVKHILFSIASHPYSDSIETNLSEYSARKAQFEIFVFHYLYIQCFQGMDPQTSRFKAPSAWNPDEPIKRFMMLTVIVNCGFMTLSKPPAFVENVLEHVFMTIYTLECIVKVCYHIAFIWKTHIILTRFNYDKCFGINTC